MNTPDDITELHEGEFIVVGTNLKGHHFGGLAKTACDLWGLQWGISRGMIGRCYAFPTLESDLRQASKVSLEYERDLLFRCASANPASIFYLTKVGCGIAGFDESVMADLFNNAPPNMVKPEGW